MSKDLERLTDTEIREELRLLSIEKAEGLDQFLSAERQIDEVNAEMQRRIEGAPEANQCS